MKRIFYIFLLILLLTGCRKKEEEIIFDVPTNIVQNGEILTWDSVEDATYYSVMIGLNEQTTIETSISLLSFENGSYDVQVRAYNKSEHSIYSDTITIVIKRDYDIPQELSFDDGLISWSSLVDSTSYTLNINGETIEVFDTSYNLSVVQNTIYEISIKANYQSGSSVFSETLYVHTFSTADTVYDTDFNRLLPIGLDVILADEISIEAFFVDGEYQPLSYITKDHEKLQFNGDWLTILSPGTYTFTLITLTSRIDINVTVYEDNNPTMLSSNTVIYNGEDMSFAFELFGGEISSLSGQDITSDDYSITEDQITIYSSFIDGILNDNPDRETVIFSYTIRKDEDIKIGYIFIQTSVQ